MSKTSKKSESVAFLLAQVGAHAASQFAQRLGPLGLTPPHAGMLRAIERNVGINQKALSNLLGLLPSRMVVLLDELQEHGLLERRVSPDDRRTHALYLTRQGSKALEGIGRVAREHDEALCAGLSNEERRTLGDLLGRLAERQGLTPGVHPGFARLGRPSKQRGPA